ncbi:hypothetical protein CKM354_001146600 [Cercospora kikuchii]|uniref:SGNH hydrolase-type esterase domain-containing protein n=1 Tax=Cercospora kikuchii TaxID=84275 RepID=A0A9P3FL19_9PEZI|nr:uncharacterized protein CKM354_001146600 [Cercospora kikuchii]GIZ48404.1 hypothetical protein CKM354_001146600 [Cercospora kikuchii]
MSSFRSLVCGLGASYLWLGSGDICQTSETAAATALYANAEIPILSDEIRCSVAPETHLRMLTIGDSITVGWGGSEYWNSYRKDLLNFLESDCPMKNRTYIGTQRTGNFVENRHEGYPGYDINQIANDTQPRLMNSILEMPNVVLLHAGTNDMVDRPGSSPGEAPDRLGKLMDMVLGTVPNVTLIVAQIIQVTEESERRALIPQLNAQIPSTAAERVARGYKVQVADLSSIGMDAVDLRDGLHPSDAGYRKMAVKWFGALQNATRAGLITPPREMYSVEGTPER